MKYIHIHKFCSNIQNVAHIISILSIVILVNYVLRHEMIYNLKHSFIIYFFYIVKKNSCKCSGITNACESSRDQLRTDIKEAFAMRNKGPFQSSGLFILSRSRYIISECCQKRHFNRRTFRSIVMLFLDRLLIVLFRL